jgi:diguanylate cyclase (GGDEF)-like protein
VPARWLIVLLLLVSWSSTTVAAQDMAITIEPVPGSVTSARAAAKGDRIILSGSGETVRVRLKLPQQVGEGPWRLWLGRDMVEELRIESGGESSPSRNFFAPDPIEPVFPAGFTFGLPDGAQQADVYLVARSTTAITLRPQLRPHAETAQVQQRLVALVSAIYATLGVLGLVALSLYLAVRDHAYLALLAFTASALAFLLAANGHLYALPGLRMAGQWGVQGVWSLMLMCAAASVWLAQRYADLRVHAPRLQRIGGGLIGILLVLAGLCLLDLTFWPRQMRWLSTASWISAGFYGLAAAVVALRMRLWNSAPIVLLIGVLLFAAALRELAAYGIGPDNFLTRYGYQLALTGYSFLLTMGLIGRIARVRAERDHERLARGDSERRLQREAARTTLVVDLQQQLRDLPPGDMEWTAFKLAFERLRPLLEVEAGALIANGFHGLDLLLAEPPSSKSQYSTLLESRQAMLRDLANAQSSLQMQFDGDGDPDVDAQAWHAVVPLPMRAPAWGVLLLRRRDGRDFSHEDLALASAFGRLAVVHADEATMATNLRRSAELDSMTGALNRRTIDLGLARSFSEAHRNASPISVLFADLDHFKAINDTHGHACGDACLRHVSAVLRRELEPSDLMGRYGGEEFLLVLPGRDADAARRLGERVRAAVERAALDWNGAQIRLTVSIGVAPRPSSVRTRRCTRPSAPAATKSAWRRRGSSDQA